MSTTWSRSEQDSSTHGAARVEWFLIAAITVIAFALRWNSLDDLAVEHFDEGVYASNLWFPDAGFRYPGQHLYAPPLQPSLVEWSILTIGESNWAPFIPALLLGSLTVPLLWWTVRNWFGGPAAIASACFIGFSDFHIAMSRSVLTDAGLLFFLLFAVSCFHIAVVRDRMGVALFAGILVGLGWATKYNGWLAGAIVASGTIAAILVAKAWLNRSVGESLTLPDKSKVDPEEAPVVVNWRNALVNLLLLSLVGFALFWVLVITGLEEHGGYSEVAKNHRRYVVGFAGWWDSATRHELVLRHYSGWLTWLGGLTAVVLATLVSCVSRSTWNVTIRGAADCGPDEGEACESQDELGERSTWNSPSVMRVVFVASLSGAYVLSPVIVIVVWSLTTLGAMLVSIRRSPDGRSKAQLTEPRSEQWLGIWFCLAWLLGLLLATPFYQPYPRLLLPFLAAGWIALGPACVMLLFGVTSKARPREVKPSQWLILVLVLAVCAWRSYRNGFRAYQDRNNLAEIAQKALADASSEAKTNPARQTREGVKFVVYVYGEPGLFYHLPQDDVPVQPVQNLDFAKPGNKHPRLATFLMIGPHARKSDVFREQLREVRDRLQIVRSYEYQPSDFVLLDDFSPHQLAKAREERIVLYRVIFD